MTRPETGETDASLSARALKGDRQAFDCLVQRYQDPLYRFIRRYVGDPAETYDLLQDTFVAAWQGLSRYDPKRPALVWLRRIALNKCRDWSRRRKVRGFFYGAAPLEKADTVPPQAPDTESDRNEAALARLDRAIAQLPSQLKEPLLLTAFEGLSQEAAGQLLGVSAKAIETRVYRARKQLAALLRADGIDVDEP